MPRCRIDAPLLAAGGVDLFYHTTDFAARMPDAVSQKVQNL